MNREKKIIITLFILLILWIGSVVYWFNSENNNKKEIVNEIRKENKIDENYSDYRTKRYKENYQTEIDNDQNDYYQENKKYYQTTAGNTNTQIQKEQVKLQCTTYINSLIKPGVNNVNSEVQKLERFLASYYKTNIVVDGYYDSSDVELVKKFQMEKGLIPDGVVGVGTRKKINVEKCIRDWVEKNKYKLSE